MIEYILSHNPDDRILKKASSIINAGGSVCLPLESHWTVMVSPFQKKGVDFLYNLKMADKDKHFSLICHSFSMAQDVAHIDNSQFKIIKKLIPGPYTFILPAQKIIMKHLRASKKDHQVGIRFPDFPYLKAFMEIHQDPVMCSQIDHTFFPELDHSTPIYSALIEEDLSQRIDLIIDPGEVEFIGSTTILDLTNSAEPQLVREGSGSLDF